MSGYTENAVAHQSVLDADVELLPKPFSFEQLLSRVRQLLDAAGPRG
jgi:DNA-binding response OmpR family regulator